MLAPFIEPGEVDVVFKALTSKCDPQRLGLAEFCDAVAMLAVKKYGGAGKDPVLAVQKMYDDSLKYFNPTPPTGALVTIDKKWLEVVGDRGEWLSALYQRYV